MPIWPSFEVNVLDWQCCLAGSSKRPLRILIFSIAMVAEYLSYVKSIATFAPTFYGYIISVLASDCRLYIGRSDDQFSCLTHCRLSFCIFLFISCFYSKSLALLKWNSPKRYTRLFFCLPKLVKPVRFQRLLRSMRLQSFRKPKKSLLRTSESSRVMNSIIKN